MGLRYGRVSSVDASRHTAQVSFEEGDGFVSWDLPVLAVRPGDYSLPPPDALVACFLEDDSSGAGVVLGCFYSDEDAAPSSDRDARLVSSAGGAAQTFGEDGAHKLDAAAGKKVEINGSDHPLPLWDTFEADLSTLLGDISTALALGTSGSPIKQALDGLATIQASVAAFRAKLAGANFDSSKGANG